MWQSHVEIPSRILIASSRSKRLIAELQISKQSAPTPFSTAVQISSSATVQPLSADKWEHPYSSTLSWLRCLLVLPSEICCPMYQRCTFLSWHAFRSPPPQLTWSVQKHHHPLHELFTLFMHHMTDVYYSICNKKVYSIYIYNVIQYIM